LLLRRRVSHRRPANSPQTGLPGQRPTERLKTSLPAAVIYGVAIQRISGAARFQPADTQPRFRIGGSR
jgi:hypothetical protein